MQTLSIANLKTNKQNMSKDPVKQIHRLKIQINDKNFQMRKMVQDHAEEKAKLYIQLQKQKQNHIRVVNEYKNRLRQDNQSWSLKMDQVKAEYARNIEQLNLQNLRMMDHQIDIHVQKIKKQYQSQIKSLEFGVKLLQQKLDQEKKSFNEQKLKIRQNLCLKHQKAQQEINQRYECTIKQIRRQYDSKVAEIEKIVIQQQSKYTKIKEQYQTYVNRNVKQKICAQRKNQSLEYDIQVSNKRIVQLTNQIKTLQNTIVQITNSGQQSLQQQRQEKGKQICTLKQQSQLKLDNLNLLNEATVNILKQQIQNLIRIHKNKQRIWEQRGKEVLQLFQKRQSKKQDKKIIQKLQIQLIKRDFIIQKERKQLKNCKLQIQNMEDVYDRIFVSNCNMNRMKSKNYHIRKYRHSNVLNESQRSTILSEKKIIA